MNKTIFYLVLLCAYSTNLLAQENNKDIFKIDDYQVHRSFTSNLPNQEKMVVELGVKTDFDNIHNLDSLLNVFLQSIAALKDSLNHGINSKRIDFVVDESLYKKIKITEYPSTANQYVFNNKELSLLKTGQDTITFTYKVELGNFYRINLFVNRLDDLSNFTNGKIGTQMQQISQANSKGWRQLRNGSAINKVYDNISAPSVYGLKYSKWNLGIGQSFNLQNYNDRLLPSVNTIISLQRRTTTKYHLFGIYSEGAIVIGNGRNGENTNLSNIFGGFIYRRTSVVPSQNSFYTFPYFSLGFLVNREGNYFDKNTFQLGIGRFNLLRGHLALDPLLFISEKKFLPSIKLVVPWL